MQNSFIATGTIESTDAAINISIGWVPDYVKVINIDGDATIEWTSDMADGEGYKFVAAGTNALVGTNGISAYAGSDTPGSEAGAGFTIGVDDDINPGSETLVWIAMREQR